MRQYTVFALLSSLAFAGITLAEPPKPPQGYKWVVNEDFSDEFNGTALDKSKWTDYNPTWVGRVPAMFVREAVSVTNGYMQIRNRMLPKPHDDYTIGSGAVCSKSDQAHYGYYECRMKASSISMSSTFWMITKSQKLGDAAVTQELDIIETIGGPKEHPNFRLSMNSNTHYFYTPEGGEKLDEAVGEHAPMSSASDEDFHTYAAWWVDANTIRFYCDDKFMFKLKPSTKYSRTPFDQPMRMNLLTETYDWEIPPTAHELADNEKNTTYYDWVRSYKLVPTHAPESGIDFRLFFTEARNWTDAKSGSTVSALLVNAVDGDALLKRDDGKIITVPIHRLSDEDQEILINARETIKEGKLYTAEELKQLKEQYRSWSDLSGKNGIEARFMRFENETEVWFVKKDTSYLKIPVKKLSTADQLILQQIALNTF